MLHSIIRRNSPTLPIMYPGKRAGPWGRSVGRPTGCRLEALPPTWVTNFEAGPRRDNCVMAKNTAVCRLADWRRVRSYGHYLPDTY